MKMEVVLLFLMMTKVLTTDIQYDHRNQSLDNRCDVCMDVITDLDAWITSDKNLDEIVQYVQGVSRDFNIRAAKRTFGSFFRS